MKVPGQVTPGSKIHIAMVCYANALAAEFGIPSSAPMLGQLLKLHDCMSKAAATTWRMASLVIDVRDLEEKPEDLVRKLREASVNVLEHVGQQYRDESELYRQAADRIEDLNREVAAYRKAKAENDDRFMAERDEARAERDKARAEAHDLRALKELGDRKKARATDVMKRGVDIKVADLSPTATAYHGDPSKLPDPDMSKGEAPPGCGAHQLQACAPGCTGAREDRKPPLGIMPRREWDRRRLLEIIEGIVRYNNNGRSIPGDWLEEARQILKADP